MTILAMLTVKLLSMLIILPSILSAIRHLMICGNNLELASELESDLREFVDWGKKWLVDFNAMKTQLVSFDLSNNNSSIDVKMGGSVLEEKSSFILRCWGWPSLLNWIGILTLSLSPIAKTASKKIEALIHSMRVLSPEVALGISVNLPYAHV